MNQSELVFGLNACGSVSSAGAAPVAGQTRLYGVVPAGVVHIGAGNYSVQLTDPIAWPDGDLTLLPTTADRIPFLVSWSVGGLITVIFTDGTGTPADTGFTFKVFRTTRPTT